MSPASYRAAPPRDDSARLPSPLRPRQIGCSAFQPGRRKPATGVSGDRQVALVADGDGHPGGAASKRRGPKPSMPSRRLSPWNQLGAIGRRHFILPLPSWTPLTPVVHFRDLPFPTRKMFFVSAASSCRGIVERVSQEEEGHSHHVHSLETGRGDRGVKANAS